MISSEKEVANGIYFVRGEIYAERVTGDETLLADGYAVVNRIQKKKRHTIHRLLHQIVRYGVTAK